jgi:hypothetical protein
VAVEGRGHLGGHHRAQHRGAERAADLHGGLLEPGRDAGQPDRRVADDHLGGAHDHAAIATTLTLADSVPALFAADLRRLAEWEERLVTVVAERAGTDPATDPRPLLVVAAFDTVFRVWSAGRSGDLDALLELVERHLDELPAALGPWT